LQKIPSLQNGKNSMSEKENKKKVPDTPFELNDAEDVLPAGDDGENSMMQDDPAGDSSSVAAELARLKTEKAELIRTMVMRQADFENYKKRIERDRQEESRRGVSRLLTDLIPVLDGYARALQAHADPAYEEYRKGLELIFRGLWDTLSKHGLERIEATGKVFDPNFHQAIEQVESSEYPDGSVAEVLQEGYLFHGRVLRPSIVRVAVEPQSAGGQKSSPVRH
jgi:molecular chaperone GrpE